MNLNGKPITQADLARYLNSTFETRLRYRDMSAADYVADRTAELGPFFGPIIGGIYDGIRQGAYDTPGAFAAVAGRAHQSWDAFFRSLTP